MVSMGNLNKLYDEACNALTITTKKLNEFGFNSKDINTLIENGTLQRVKRGFYSFLAVDNLYLYGVDLINNREYEKGYSCFEKCFEINKHTGASLQLFLKCIRDNDYSSAFNYFDYITSGNNPHYVIDSNYYLFLLSMITDIPEQYKERIRNISYSELKVKPWDKRYSDYKKYNKVRLSTYNQRFGFAHKQITEIVNENGKMSVQDVITRTLISKANDVQALEKDEVFNLTKDKKYDDLVETLKDREKKHELCTSDSYMLYLVDVISKIKNTDYIPTPNVQSATDMFDAINGENYPLALELSTRYLSDRNIDPNVNSINLLLRDIVELISEKQSSPSSEFNEVINNILNDNVDNSFKILDAYLNKINKSQYKFLLVDLIKLSLLEKDTLFTRPMLVHSHIINDSYNFSLESYLQQFYEALSRKSFDEARIYLDILSKASTLGYPCNITDLLAKVLIESEYILSGKKRVIDDSKSVPLVSDSSVVNDSKENVVHKPESPVKYRKSIEVTSKEKNNGFDAFEYISSLKERLIEKGIVLLKPMSRVRMDKIYDIIANFSDIASFEIGSGNNVQIVLRYKPYSDTYINFKETMEDGKEAYRQGDYNSCIKCFKQILEQSKPKSYIYAQLGLAYMKKFDKKTAIDYLTVATELSKSERRNHDFSDLIASLKGLIDPEDRKPNVRMKISDFGNDLDNSYGINNIDEIRDLVSSGTSIDEISDLICLDDNDKALVMLILARDCYSIENYELGDEYLRRVEKVKEKSKQVKTLLDEVRRNKKFYKNRISEEQKKI